MKEGWASPPGAKMWKRRCLPLAERHPYSPGPGGIAAAITQFRKSFPTTVNADTLKQLGIAPKNESYVINVMRFIGAIGKDGKQTNEALTVFSHHSDADFQKDFEKMVKTAYSDLFALHKDGAWSLDADKLIAFFRSKDKTTDLVGRLQASTFQLLSGFAGHGAVPTPAPPKTTAKPKPNKNKAQKPAAQDKKLSQNNNGDKRDIGLTVRIEVNLPPAGDQDTYDRIFRSIRENLLNAK
jgi:Family of unknown function (DUF5343)